MKGFYPLEKYQGFRKAEVITTIGMSVGSFVALFVAGLIAAAVLQYIARYRVLEGFDGFPGKVIAGWIGAWLGSPVFGHWFGHFLLASVYIIPAPFGAFTITFPLTASEKALVKMLSPYTASGVRSAGERLVA